MTFTRMHEDEVGIDETLVRRLLESQFPQWAALPLAPVLPFGTDNANFRLGDDMMVRLPRHEPSVRPLQKELEWLPMLAPRLPLAVPTPLAAGDAGSGYPFPWAIYRWLEGEPAVPDRIADPQNAALQLSGFIAALQRIDPTGGPVPARPSSRGVPLAQRDAATRRAIAALRQEIDVDAVTGIWEEAVGAPVWDGSPVWLHGDLDSRNILARDGRLCAIIDWGTTAVGDPAYDVMVAWKLLPADTRETFRNALSVDDATWTRARGLTLSQALIALPYYTMETNPTLVLEARRWLAAVLEDGRAGR